MKKKILYLITMILLPFLLAGLTSLIIPNYQEFYASIKKPFEVPSVVFPIVWSVIYVLIGVAAYFVLKNRENTSALKIYYVQLFFNVTWTLIFFGFRNLDIALIWTYLLLLAVIINAWVFLKANKVSGLLFIPYLLWTVFATYLTTAIWLLN